MAERSKSIRLQCPCGVTLVAETEDELVELANQHLMEEHPDLAGKYAREQILLLAY